MHTPADDPSRGIAVLRRFRPSPARRWGRRSGAGPSPKLQPRHNRLHALILEYQEYEKAFEAQFSTWDFDDVEP